MTHLLTWLVVERVVLVMMHFDYYFLPQQVRNYTSFAATRGCVEPEAEVDGNSSVFWCDKISARTSIKRSPRVFQPL